MTNVDLGSVIWVNVTRKFLSLHKYFFIRFDKLPRWVQRFFRLFKHTHHPVTLESSCEHHSHAHLGSAGVTSSTTSHAHTESPGSTDCGYSGVPHTHNFSLGTSNSHSHGNCVFNFSSANLGSPWWNHTHPMVLASMNAGGGSHTHTFPGYTAVGACTNPLCQETPHGHATPARTVGNGGSSHTHTITGQITGVADSGATPESHTHDFTITFDEGNSHTHSYSSAVVISNANCAFFYSHAHSAGWTTSSAKTHIHNCTGTSGSGGEPEAPPTGQPYIARVQHIEGMKTWVH